MYSNDVYNHDVTLIMSKEDYDQVESEYKVIRIE